ncbi:hybrid sensor histidine kinase/response regulator [Desulfomonile tiedjei]|uniref:histidine kinase n=1 Tax=Desulfomonile tiedjei (strain ATCC 49306 / DSM 6799 / DCB-1) TaxID=706587 RepID=I4CEY4_DESTA|nr:AAA family ATPase [Desulfomonile tiedjei]AFM28125.1 putative ATPase [Desulfomonile tiedjei DSM 6799]
MRVFPGYLITETIYRGTRSLVVRATRGSDGTPVILKTFTDERPSIQETDRRKKEYKILESLNLEGVIKAYGIEDHGRGPVLVLEDCYGSSLDRIESHFFSVPEILRIGSELAGILGEIHSAQIIHKDVNPSNIVLNPATGIVKLIDFDLAGTFSREQAASHDTKFSGTLQYMSPEQTGRTALATDYRTDYYSLGMTLYELLCAKIPFDTQDPLEIIHSQIARMPESPAEVNPEIPQIVSDIIMKLLAKNPDQRYQSAWGIKWDLNNCLKQLKESGSIEAFPLASTDRPERLRIPQKLYGRDRERAELAGLLTGFKQGTKRFGFVAGDPGIGKTALVMETFKSLPERFFAWGKCEQFSRNFPYSALKDAALAMLQHILMGNDQQLQRYREKLLSALGPNAGILSDLIPELELVIGSQPAPSPAEPQEFRNRFNLAFFRFFQVFCEQEEPLILFLDDLQWIDTASLSLLEFILTDSDIGHLVFIGAFRDKEIDAQHSLHATIDRLKTCSEHIPLIKLQSLDLDSVNAICADALNTNGQSVGQLADLVLKKTGGNPFHVGEFLMSLYLTGLLIFDHRQGVWQWDLSHIQSRNITDNIVELMADKIQRLNEETQACLKLAACLGSRFSLEDLALVMKKEESETEEFLSQAVEEGLLLPLEPELSLSLLRAGVDRVDTAEFRFCHDRVQQAAYGCIPDEEKRFVHATVGRLLLQGTPRREWDKKILNIVDQLNLGLEFITEKDERMLLAELNLLAGRKAHASAAFEAGLKYFQAGIRALKEYPLPHGESLALELYRQLAESAYLTGNFVTMEFYCKKVLEHSQEILDKAKVCEIRIQASTAQYKMIEAVQTAIPVLRMLGVRIPRKPSRLHLFWALTKGFFIFRKRDIDSLGSLPVMTDSKKLAALKIMSKLGKALYAAHPEFAPVVTLKSLELSIRYGISRESVLAYAILGFLYIGVLGDINKGYALGNLALRLTERFDTAKLRVNIVMIVNFFVKPWKEHYAKLLGTLQEAIGIGIENGSLEDAAHCAYMYCSGGFRVGWELPALHEKMTQYSELIRKIKHESALRLLFIFHQTVLNLMGKSPDPCTLVGDVFDENIMLRVFQEANDRSGMCVTYLNKATLCYIFEEHSKALENVMLAQKHESGILGTPAIPTLNFYDSLARLSVCDKTKQKIHLWRVHLNQRKLRKWAKHAPMNFLHKYILVKAELLRIKGKYELAGELYEQAITLARENAYQNEEALANELAGKFYLSRSNLDLARTKIVDAHYCYKKWGAAAKVEQLEAKYRLFFEGPAESQIVVTSRDSASTGSTDFHRDLDLAWIMKASQVISGEILLEKLVEKLMKTVIETAGAEKGFLIFRSGNRLEVKAEACVSQMIVQDLQPTPIEKCELCSAVVMYVLRTSESLVLNDPVREGAFTSDPYIMEKKPKSVLCVPILHHGSLIGMLYLENNLSSHAFTPHRLETLRMLSSQAAISIENARLYERMEQLVAERTSELEKSNKDLSHEIEVRQSAQEELYRAKIQAESASRAKSEFLAHMSHELRTPLNAIIGFSQLLNEQWGGKLTEKQLQYVREISIGGHHLLELINNILDLAKVESGKMELDLKPVNIGQLLKHCTIMIKEKALRKHLDIIVHIPESLRGVKIVADEVKFKQIVVNLLSNAAKFTPDEGRIELEASMEPNALSISVSDTGIGILQEDQERIFEPFVQLNAPVESRQKGTGLGLALTRELVELHGGTIHVQSAGFNQGSTFVFSIPVDQVFTDPSSSSDLASSSLVRTYDRIQDNPSEATVLVVEDNEANVRLIRELLEKQSYRVIHKSTAEEGVAAFLTEGADLILMDVGLPGMDGLTATKIIREHSQLVPIVALTAHAMDSDREKALEAGCNEYLRKPIKVEEFYDTIRRLIDRDRKL